MSDGSVISPWIPPIGLDTIYGTVGVDLARNFNSLSTATSVDMREEMKKELEETKGSEMWAVRNGSIFTPCDESKQRLDAAQYNIGYSDSIGIFFTKTEPTLDDIVEVGDATTDAIMKSINTFWGLEDRYTKYGMVWKRGYFIHGPPGGGKTTCIQAISKKVIENDGVVMYGNDISQISQGIQIFRQIEKTRPILVILEEIDQMIHHGEAQHDLLAMLDGELQVPNIVFVATTNFPEKVPDNVKNRPSRFDEHHEVGFPDENVRTAFFTAKFTGDDEEFSRIPHWVKNSATYSFAHMKELIVSVKILGIDFDDAKRRLDTLTNSNPSSAKYDTGKTSMGFSR